MKALVTLAVVILSFSTNDADAQFDPRFRPVELTSHGVARQSPYAPIAWRGRGSATPADYAPTLAPRGFAPSPHAASFARAMPVACETPWRGQPTMSRYGGDSPCACMTVPVSQLAPPGYADPMNAAGAGYYVGKGVLGQPKLFVTGQPLRNALRFFTY